MPSRITKNGKMRWKGRVQRGHKIITKLFNSKTDALAWEAEMRGLEEWRTPTVCLTLLDWANQYLDFCRATKAASTYEEKQLAFKRLFRCVEPALPADRLTPLMVLKTLRQRAEAQSGYAANKDRKNLLAAWTWGAKFLGLPATNPVGRVDRFPEEQQPRHVPSLDDFWRVYAVADGQDKAMLAAFLYLAARRGEVFRLKWEHVDFERRRIMLSTRKRRGGSLQNDWLPMADDLWEQLAQLRATRIPSPGPHAHVFLVENDFDKGRIGQPFTKRRHFMARVCEKADVPYFTWHAIRHLTASVLYERGYPVAIIQAILRHKNPNTTARYLRSLGLEDTRQALQSLSATKQPVVVIEFPQKGSPPGATPEGLRNAVGANRFRKPFPPGKGFKLPAITP